MQIVMNIDRQPLINGQMNRINLLGCITNYLFLFLQHFYTKTTRNNSTEKITLNLKISHWLKLDFSCVVWLK